MRNKFRVQENAALQDELMGSMTYRIPYRVVELVQDNEYFMAAVAATIDEPNKKRFNYTQPISVQKYTFILRQPDEVSRIYLFTAPFTLQTWGCLAGIILVTAPMLYTVNRLVPLQELRIRGLSTVKSCFWYIYGALLQQGKFADHDNISLIYSDSCRWTVFTTRGQRSFGGWFLVDCCHCPGHHLLW